MGLILLIAVIVLAVALVLAVVKFVLGVVVVVAALVVAAFLARRIGAWWHRSDADGISPSTRSGALGRGNRAA